MTILIIIVVIYVSFNCRKEIMEVVRQPMRRRQPEIPMTTVVYTRVAETRTASAPEPEEVQQMPYYSTIVKSNGPRNEYTYPILPLPNQQIGFRWPLESGQGQTKMGQWRNNKKSPGLVKPPSLKLFQLLTIIVGSILINQVMTQKPLKPSAATRLLGHLSIPSETPLIHMAETIVIPINITIMSSTGGTHQVVLYSSTLTRFYEVMIKKEDHLLTYTRI